MKYLEKVLERGFFSCFYAEGVFEKAPRHISIDHFIKNPLLAPSLDLTGQSSPETFLRRLKMAINGMKG
jgi:hypothetical protein